MNIKWSWFYSVSWVSFASGKSQNNVSFMINLRLNLAGLKPRASFNNTDLIESWTKQSPRSITSHKPFSWLVDSVKRFYYCEQNVIEEQQFLDIRNKKNNRKIKVRYNLIKSSSSFFYQGYEENTIKHHIHLYFLYSLLFLLAFVSLVKTFWQCDLIWLENWKTI